MESSGHVVLRLVGRTFIVQLENHDSGGHYRPILIPVITPGPLLCRQVALFMQVTSQGPG